MPPYGGQFAIDQASALQRLGHEVRVLHCQQLGATVYPYHYLTARYGRWWEKNNDIEIYRTNFRGIPHTVRHNMQRYCNIISSMFNEYVALHGSPDVIHAHCGKWAGIAAHNIHQSTGIPFFITEHMSRGAYERDFGTGWQKHLWAKQLIANAYQAANCVIPVARELIETTTDFFGCSYKWTEISNLIDVDFFRYKERPPLTGRPFRFCCLAVANGKWFYYKGYDVLLEAFKGISNAELHIAGRATAGPAMQQATQGISNVILHGDLNKAQVRQLLYNCDALVLPSRTEVQPLVLLEAMSTGIPVVSTEAIPQSERIQGASIIVPIGDAPALQNAMKQVMDIKPSLTISHNISQLASPATVAKQLEQLFTQQWKR